MGRHLCQQDLEVAAQQLFDGIQFGRRDGVIAHQIAFYMDRPQLGAPTPASDVNLHPKRKRMAGIGRRLRGHRKR
jgi:hypothetical protein